MSHPGMTSFLSSLKRLDIYRSVPKDLTEPTMAGASISIISGLIIAVLFISELATYLTVTTRHEMFIDHRIDTGVSARATGLRGLFGLQNVDPHLAEEAAMMRINFNITMPSMSCAITTVGVQDVLGSDIDVASQIHKYRTDSDGRLKLNEVSGQPLTGDHGAQRDQIGEGCCVVGHIMVKKVPGEWQQLAAARACTSRLRGSDSLVSSSSSSPPCAQVTFISARTPTRMCCLCSVPSLPAVLPVPLRRASPAV